MPYRDGPPRQRVAELDALLASEPQIREDRTRIRREHDALCHRADALARELDGGDRGLVATVTGWFAGGDRETEHAVMRAELEAATARISELVRAERDLEARFTALAGARTELAALETSVIGELRVAEGASGNDLRAIDATVTADAATIAVMEAALDSIERTQKAITSLRDHAASIGSTTTAIGFLDDDDATVRMRTTDAIDYLKNSLRYLGLAFEALVAAWPAAQVVPEVRLQKLAMAAVATPRSQRTFERDAASLVPRLDVIVEAIVSERDRLVRRCDELDGRRAAIVADALRGLRIG
ncbi:MAG: hypothetical protein ABI867_42255 [Kofleriaceae bacterium]